MDGRVIIWSKRAELSYDDILLYYSSNTKRSKYGKKLHKKVTELTFNLLKFPELAKAVEHSDYRVFVIDNYSLYYKILESEIFIALFWDNRRSPDLFLSELSKPV
jgi:plasmid stabilization system protein ParE